MVAGYYYFHPSGALTSVKPCKAQSHLLLNQHHVMQLGLRHLFPARDMQLDIISTSDLKQHCFPRCSHETHL